MLSERLYLLCSALLIPSQMRRTAGPTELPPAKTPGALRVGATGASGATERIAEASVAAVESCSAEARRKREPDCCPPVEPNHNPRIESETEQQETGPTLRGRLYHHLQVSLQAMSYSYSSLTLFLRMLDHSRIEPFPSHAFFPFF